MDGASILFMLQVGFAGKASCARARARVCLCARGEIPLLAELDLTHARLNFHQTMFHATGSARELRCVRALKLRGP